MDGHLVPLVAWTFVARRDEAGARRDEAGYDRDDHADDRDTVATNRDQTAQRRDRLAADRDSNAGRRDRQLFERLSQLRALLDHRLQEIADSSPSQPGGALTAGVLAGLRAFVADQGRLAALSRDAIHGFLDELQIQIASEHSDRRAAAQDRRDAAADRSAAARDRVASQSDRVVSAADRDQAAIDRAQCDLPGHLNSGRVGEPMAHRMAAALTASAQLMADSDAVIAQYRPAPRHLHRAEPPTTAEDGH